MTKKTVDVDISKVLRRMKALEIGARRDHGVSVSVGFNAEYAIHVHENLESEHQRGQAKFLEQPFREKRDEIMDVVRGTYRRTENLAISLTMGGLRLQKEAQLLVPVDTGNLKGSAFTEVDE